MAVARFRFRFRAILLIMLLVAAGLVAASTFAFITAYNEFIVALTFPGQAHSGYTLPIYVTYFFGRGAQWGPTMAASTLYTIPVMIFFLIVPRRMVNGLVAGAVMG